MELSQHAINLESQMHSFTFRPTASLASSYPYQMAAILINMYTHSRYPRYFHLCHHKGMKHHISQSHFMQKLMPGDGKEKQVHYSYAE